jgi:hypothetical protein
MAAAAIATAAKRDSESEMRNRRTDVMVSNRFNPAVSGTTSTAAIREDRSMTSRGFKALMLVLLLLVVFPARGRAQTISATLSGFVFDQTDAVVPGAKVTLTNQASKDKRVTTSNGSGYFNFTAVPAATYTVLVQREGFKSYEEKGIELHPSDQRNLTDIRLQVGAVESTVTVTTASSAAPPTTGERSVLITAEDINHLPVEGRDVTELIKTLPGFAQVAQGTGADNLAPDPGVVGGQTGNYEANGTPPEGISIISDGVNITDPGNGASSDQVINMDNVQEVQVQTSNFGADSAKGPIVINAVGKSGGADFHGGLYVYGRTYQLNTQDWFSKHDGDAKPEDRYIYPGGNIGGPIKIPGTNLNHNKKLTFFVGGEDYVQKNVYAYGSAAAATVEALVPTKNMRTGNFTQSELSNYFGVPVNATTCSTSPNATLSLYINICNIPSGNTPGLSPNSQGVQGPDGPPIIGGNIPQIALDPGALALMNGLVPLPNHTPFFSNPAGTATGEQLSVFNYQQVNLQDNSSYQTRARVDYSISDNSKIYVAYDFQHSNGRNPQQLFYSPQQPFGEINTPNGILGEDFSHTASMNFTRVLTSSLTNEFYVGVNLNLGHNSPGKAGSYLSSSINYPYQGIYPTLQYPQLYDYGFDGLPLGLFPDYSSKVFQHKFVPNGGDNLTKVIGTHTIKVGGYLERATNNQTDLNVASNGQIQQYYLGELSPFGGVSANRIYEPTLPGQTNSYANYPEPGNFLASFFMGEIQQYNQFNFQTNSDLYYWTADSYATDSWKVNKKLTLDLGFRLGHVGPWEDAHGLGMAVWNPTLYASETSITSLRDVSSTVPNPGFTWHAIDKSIPNSGAGSTRAFFSPRFGMAWDAYGNGKTVVRGGIGAYRSHDSWNDVNQTQATAQGQTYATVGGGGLMLRDIPALIPASGISGGNATQAGTSGVGFGLSSGDNEQPLTWTYSFTLSQQVNPSTLFETSYQGSQSSDLLTQYEQGAAGDIENIDSLPIGTLFNPDPLTGEVNTPQGFSGEDHVNDFRPYPFYTQVNVARHILYSNYNALQTSIKKTQGRGLYSVNYTWSKVMGVFGAYNTGNMIDSRNIRPNYGPLAFDRSHVVNATYSYNVGNWVHGSKLLGGLANQWELSGIFNIQSGPDAQRVLNSNFGLGGTIAPLNGVQTAANSFNINNLTFLGTPDVVLQPKITCNPGTGVNRSQHQYLNSACFAIPDFGVNGPASIPYIHTPGYFDADARLGKDIRLGDRKDFQFLLSAFNVINRANYSFSSKFPTEQTLRFTGDTLSDATTPADFGSAQFRFGRRVAEITMKYNF